MRSVLHGVKHPPHEYSSLFVSVFTDLCKPTPQPHLRTFSAPPNEAPYPFAPPTRPDTTSLIAASMDLSVVGTPRWNRMISGHCVGLPFDHSQGHLCGNVCQDLIAFDARRYSTVCLCHGLCILVSVDGCLGSSFHFLAVISNAAMGGRSN